MRRPLCLFRRWQLPNVARTIALGWLATGCYSSGDGISPPQDRVYFPVGLALTNEAKYLAVVNSDFDLQFNAGTLFTLDVNGLTEVVPTPCEKDTDCADAGEYSACDADSEPSDGEEHAYTCVKPDERDACLGLGERSPADRLLFPGRCKHIDVKGYDVLKSTVQIGAFATDAVFLPRPAEFGGGNGRLFVPVRGDATLHWAEITSDGAIECGQPTEGGPCDGAHRAGDNPDQENTRDLRLSPEPFGVAADPEGTAVLVTNQTTGRVSLFENDWIQNSLSLQFEVTNLPSRPMSAAALPPPGIASVTSDSYAPGFLVTFRNSPEVDLIRYFPETDPATDAHPARPYGSRASAVPITVNSIGSDQRGIAIDDSTRRASEAECAVAAGVSSVSESCRKDRVACDAAENSYIDCLRSVASTPLDVFIASRLPSSLLVGRTTPVQTPLQGTDLPAFFDTVSMSQGASRVVTGKILDRDDQGQEVFEPRVFVSCFDSRRVFVYDPVRRRIDVEIATGRGPHALAVDEAHGWLFVGHFTDSFIGVVSLDRRFTRTYGKILATIGEPSAPRASK